MVKGDTSLKVPMGKKSAWHNLLRVMLGDNCLRKIKMILDFVEGTLMT